MLDEIYFTVLLILVGFVFGKISDFLSCRRLDRKEDMLKDITVVSTVNPFPVSQIADTVFIGKEVVLAVDYYKKALCLLLSLFGFNIYIHERLIELARRHVIVRLQEVAISMKADGVVNLKVDIVTIGSPNFPLAIAAVASGTAIELKRI